LFAADGLMFAHGVIGSLGKSLFLNNNAQCCLRPMTADGNIAISRTFSYFFGIFAAQIILFNESNVFCSRTYIFTFFFYVYFRVFHITYFILNG